MKTAFSIEIRQRVRYLLKSFDVRRDAAKTGNFVVFCRVRCRQTVNTVIVASVLAKNAMLVSG